MGIDYYAVLSLPRDCSIIDIRLAYRKWAIATHPYRKKYPRHPENPPEGILDELPLPALPCGVHWEYVNEAYDVLSNYLTREIYDKYGEEGLKTGMSAPDGYVQPYIYHGDCMRTYQQVFGSYSPYADLVDAITNPTPLYNVAEGTGTRIKERDVERLLYLDLKEVSAGCVKKLKMLRQEFVDELKTLTRIKEKILTIQIPPGIGTGTQIRFIEEGDQGPTKIPADIVFIIADLKHEVYTRCGPDLLMTHAITLHEALTGFDFYVTTIDNRRIKVVIDEVVNPDYRKVIEGEGLPIYKAKDESKGDIIVGFEIEFPKYLSRTFKAKLHEVFGEIEEEEKKASIVKCKAKRPPHRISNKSLTSRHS